MLFLTLSVNIKQLKWGVEYIDKGAEYRTEEQ